MNLDDELASLNVRIRKLRIQFDLFFSGALPKPPLWMRDDLDRDIKRVGSNREMKLAHRFLYNTILNRWNVFTELWNKKLQAREEGTRTPPAARRRDATTPTTPVVKGESQTPERGRRLPPQEGLVARAAIRNATDSSRELKEFYRAFLEAQQEIGARKTPSYEKFCQEIDRRAAAIRQQKSCEAVDFRLYLRDNKVSLKVRAIDTEKVES